MHFDPAQGSPFMCRDSHTPSFMPPGRKPGRRAGGYTLIEMMVVVIVITMVVGMTAGVTDSLKSNRGTTAAQQLVSVLDSARAKALSGQSDIWFVIANGEARSPALPFRSYAVCTTVKDENLPEGQILLPLTAWEHLPQGYVFTITAPALPSAGVNLASHPGSTRRVRISASNPAGMANFPSIGFGSLGEVEFPEDEPPLLLAVAEGEVRANLPRMMNGTPHEPSFCRWLSVQRNTGKAVLLP